MNATPVLVFISCVTAASFTRANLVTNGDFEDPPVRNRINGFDTYIGGESFGGWTVGGHSIDVVSDAKGSWVWWNAASGHQSVDLNGLGAGSVWQDIATVPQQSYALSFAVAANIASAPWQATMEFLWHGQVVDTICFHPTWNCYDPGWTYLAYQLTAETDQARLIFTSLSPGWTGGMILDDVCLQPLFEQVPDTQSRWLSAALLLPLVLHRYGRPAGLRQTPAC
ncbi:MAG: DUF642 domain-containing protein [Verrucomicrobiota bacterium]